jgi:hypothetical protein
VPGEHRAAARRTLCDVGYSHSYSHSYSHNGIRLWNLGGRKRGGAVTAQLQGLVQAERSLPQQVFQAASVADLEVVGMLDPIVTAMKNGQRSWFASGDGHINDVGHQIAATLLRPYCPR